MADADALIPRVFIARHVCFPRPLGRASSHSPSLPTLALSPGETEWAKSGRHTGITDIPLTPHGIAQVGATATQLVGLGRLLDPTRLTHIFVSPRQRAQQTFRSLLGSHLDSIQTEKITLTEDIAKWKYGDYEGLRAHEIKSLRKERGLDKERGWSVWRDGCEGGE
jgi:sedoheptulose-bisphosphatase